MKKKLIGSYYPSCNSKKTSFIKGEVMDGEIYVNNGNLVFQRKILLCFKGKTRLEIPLKSIERVENCTLNGFMPYGVCIFTKDNKEYILGHVNNKNLQDFVMNAKAGVIPEIREKKSKKNSKRTKIINLIIGTVLIILFALLVFMGVINYKQETIVKDELAIINTLDASIDTINMEIKASGNHGKIEKAMKEYYTDYFSKKKIFNSNRAEALFNIFTVGYLKETKSKLKSLKLEEMVDTKTKELNEAVDGIISMLESHNIMSYIYKYDLKLYYNNFYRDNMVSKKDSIIQKEWEDIKEKNTIKIDYLKKVLSILINNNDDWYIENDTLYFSNDKLLGEYNKLHSLIYDSVNDEVDNASL